jgi:ribosomal protein RSM22 (predicted rRNA methylase)
MSTRLPDPLFAALVSRLHLVPLTTLKAGYKALSRDYRGRTVSEEKRDDLAPEQASEQGGRAPGGYTRAQARALGYLAARFPATRQVPQSALDGCASVLDIGAGPGTATWALYDRLPALSSARLLESNAEMIGHAQALSQAYPQLHVSYHSGDLAEQLTLAPQADLVVLAYLLSETSEGEQEALLQKVWDKAKHGIFLLEPGTPDTSRRVLAARDQWTRLGASLVAPCPQSGPCPMDPARRDPLSKEPLAWCHFAVRLERRGLHKAVKGGDLGYEDEKFSWIFVSKTPGLAAAAPYRLHSDPRRVNRNINLDVCDAQGNKANLFYRRRDTGYNLRHAARQLQWGDGWNPSTVPPDLPDSDNEGEE